MKKIRTKSFWIFALLISIGLFTDKVAIIISDGMQKKICTNEICITKPKGWLPVFVDRDNDRFFLDLISESYIPFMDFEMEEDKSSSILLYKDTENIFITQSKFVPSKRTEKYFQKFEYMSKIYYVNKSIYVGGVTVYYPKNELYITMQSFDKNLLNEICTL